MKSLFPALILFVILVIAVGCGNGGGSGSSGTGSAGMETSQGSNTATPSTGSGSGSNDSQGYSTLRFTIIWPEETGKKQRDSFITLKRSMAGKVEMKAIPAATKSIKISIFKKGTDTKIVDDVTVNRQTGQSTVTVTVEKLSLGWVTIKASAYDGTNGSGTLLTYGQTNLEIVAGSNAADIALQSTTVRLWPGPRYDETGGYLFNGSFTTSPAVISTLDCGAKVDMNFVIFRKEDIYYYATGVTGGKVRIFNVKTGALVADLTLDSALTSNAEMYLSGDNIVVARKTESTPTATPEDVAAKVDGNMRISIKTYPEGEVDNYPSEINIYYAQINAQYISTSDWSLSPLITNNTVRKYKRKYLYVKTEEWDDPPTAMIRASTVIIYRGTCDLESGVTVFSANSDQDVPAYGGPTGHPLSTHAGITSAGSSLISDNKNVLTMGYYCGALPNFETYYNEWGFGNIYRQWWNVWDETTSGNQLYKDTVSETGTVDTTNSVGNKISVGIDRYSIESDSFCGYDMDTAPRRTFMNSAAPAEIWYKDISPLKDNNTRIFRRNFSDNTDALILRTGTAFTSNIYVINKSSGDISLSYPSLTNFYFGRVYAKDGKDVALGMATGGFLCSVMLDGSSSSLNWTSTLNASPQYVDNGLAFSENNAVSLANGATAFNYQTVIGKDNASLAGYDSKYLYIRYRDSANSKDIIYVLGSN
jgi:hypothetical protein